MVSLQASCPCLPEDAIELWSQGGIFHNSTSHLPQAVIRVLSEQQKGSTVFVRGARVSTLGFLEMVSYHPPEGMVIPMGVSGSEEVKPHRKGWAWSTPALSSPFFLDLLTFFHHRV